MRFLRRFWHGWSKLCSGWEKIERKPGGLVCPSLTRHGGVADIPVLWLKSSDRLHDLIDYAKMRSYLGPTVTGFQGLKRADVNKLEPKPILWPVVHMQIKSALLGKKLTSC